MSENATLKPCPFCGYAETVEDKMDEYTHGPALMLKGGMVPDSVSCLTCGATMPAREGDTESTLESRWNQRETSFTEEERDDCRVMKGHFERAVSTSSHNDELEEVEMYSGFVLTLSRLIEGGGP